MGRVRELSWLHPAMFTIGLLIAGTAVRWGWPTLEAWRHPVRASQHA
jgi:hypothetical protein